MTRALRFGFRLNHGETCIAPHRVFVARPLADDLKKRLADAAERECYESRTPACAGRRRPDLRRHPPRSCASSLAESFPTSKASRPP